MKIVLISNCSVTRAKEPVATMDQLGTGLNHQEALQKWFTLISDPMAEKFSPGEIYRGGGFQETLSLAELYDIDDIRIVTGGQGLISYRKPIVPYDFSASRKEELNIHQHVTAEPFSQHRWWMNINSLVNETPTPVADIVKDPTVDLVVIACTKIFVKYFERDLLSALPAHRDKVKIFISESSKGAIIQQLRDTMRLYSRRMIGHLPGNRMNTTQRAASVYLEKIVKEGFTIKQADEYWAHILRNYGNDGDGDPDDENSETEHVTAEQYLQEHPDLLKLTAEQAYGVVRSQLGNVGGTIAFNGIFRRMSGFQVIGQSNDLAKSLLASLVSMPPEKVLTDVDEEETIKLLAIMTASLRDLGATPQLTAPMICSWAKAYCTQIKSNLPVYLESPAKLARLLSNNASVVGLKELVTPSVSGKRYGLLPTNA